MLDKFSNLVHNTFKAKFYRGGKKMIFTIIIKENGSENALYQYCNEPNYEAAKQYAKENYASYVYSSTHTVSISMIRHSLR
jgi:hypothetical protein